MGRAKSFTLIELIITMLIISILSAVTGGTIAYLARILLYLPQQVKIQATVEDAMDVMLNGSEGKRGIRYVSAIKDASAAQFTYTFGYPALGDKRNMRFRFSSGKLYRSYTNLGDIGPNPAPAYSSEESIPYYARGDVSISGISSSPSAIFKYYKSDGNEWQSGPLDEIARVEVGLAAKSGMGRFDASEAYFEASSGVEIRNYNR